MDFCFVEGILGVCLAHTAFTNKKEELAQSTAGAAASDLLAGGKEELAEQVAKRAEVARNEIHQSDDPRWPYNSAAQFS
uniref:Uncharacterized protein n=1 Tax=Oryza punctata TaxID=4537 RepID=A0A0E0L8L4_ORYPU